MAKVLVRGHGHEYLEVFAGGGIEKKNLVGRRAKCDGCKSHLRIQKSDLPRIRKFHYDNGSGEGASCTYDYWGMSCPICREHIQLAETPYDKPKPLFPKNSVIGRLFKRFLA